ncbi:right-handed parallel beta-helix repeat-containing protein [Niabella pedocola]|uniref:Right-handed parallel beta-helix repeat-containing protein n=1 Tax=Niabella pedocola TaxID=1752077 RepID=A0ABS8PMD4_9BACT|nr:PDZ domain-containing protein [Niabella pedocola]MCD2421909.1 right-handed parallel beta-helix repeat-containing protein [Niabella pedocola]
MHKKRTIILLLLLLPVLLQAARAQTKIFVATTGNDQSAGTLSAPFRTLQKALSVAAAGKSAATILLRGGTYYLDKTVIIDAARFNAAALAITAYNNEQVTISAGRPLQLRWEPYRDGIYKTAVPAGLVFEQLYVNNRLQVLARYPNYDSSARVFHGTSADAINKEKVRQWKNPAGGYVHALHAHEWGGFHYRISGVKPDGNLELDGGWQNNRPAPMHPQYRFVENIFEELDAPGEWFLDRSKNELYYYPAQGLRLPEASIVVAALKNSIVLSGTVENPLRHVRLEGLNFLHNERSFMETREPLVRSDWTIYRGGAVLMDGTENCVIKNCNFTELGGNAIMVSNYNKRDTISGCHIAWIGANAVSFIGDAKALRSPSFRYEDYISYDQLDQTPGPLNSNYPQQCVVTDNLLHDLGQIEKQATGVQIEMAAAITVSYNSIYNTPRAGLNIGDGAFGGHLLEHNDVFNTVLETGDHGAFNSWGRDRYWSANRRYMDSIVALHPELILLDARAQTVIRNNRFRCDHGWDIDLDDGSSNYHIYNNVCLNGGIKLREGFHRIVENNIMVNNSFHPHVWFRNSGDVFRHNIVLKKYFPIQIKYWGLAVDSNLFPDAAALQLAQNNGTDRHSRFGDPRFRNAAQGNYTVVPGSPALKIGFVNFSMHFGVQLPALKKLAQQPAIPVINTGGIGVTTAIADFLGGKVKSVEGLGDRSAYGLPDETGVVVIAAGSKSLLAISGLQEKDVIRSADGKAIKNLKDLMEIYSSSNWKGHIPVTIIRNQQSVNLELKTR